ncbi:protein TolR [Glycocaulis profundi]|jgi:biopolymer transport protein TolR|nr:protein TolR [Glycocaulis profundi]
MAGNVDMAGRRGRRTWKPKAEINIVPYVDVMLVLLIVFMVAAPLLTVGVEVDLPNTEAQAMTTSEEPMTITIQRDGTIYLQETQVAYEELIPRLRAIAGTGSEARIFIRGDDGVEYGAVMRVMARVSSAGYTNLGLVTDPAGE